jgi:hypothetical protein
MMRRLAVFVLLTVVLTSCASIEGTRDKSRTMRRSLDGAEIETVAVLPIAEDAAFPGLSIQLADAIAEALRVNFPAATVITADEFGTSLARYKFVAHFGRWKAAYHETSILDPGPLRFYAEASSARYFLLVRSISLNREKIRAVDSGRNGWVSDAKNVWRARLRCIAELIDTQTGRIAWRGVGEAENINSPRKDLDFGLVIQHQRNPDLDHFVPEMIDIAAKGVARQIASGNR